MKQMEQFPDLYTPEVRLWKQGFKRVMGLDEVGRGCLCGPVVAAGVILHPWSRLSEGVQDSKKLSKQKRTELANLIQRDAAFWVVKECSAMDIDQLNILRASLKAMVLCSESDAAVPDYLLVDGNRFTDTLIPSSCLVKGDSLSVSIAAASILAKVYRDARMQEAHLEYPQYGWNKNVGYPTKEHYRALSEYGITPYHRKSFKLGTHKVFSQR